MARGLSMLRALGPEEVRPRRTCGPCGEGGPQAQRSKPGKDVSPEPQTIYPVPGCRHVLLSDGLDTGVIPLSFATCVSGRKEGRSAPVPKAPASGRRGIRGNL